MSANRDPIPGGVVSTIRGRWQGPWLTWLSRLVLVASLVAAVLPGTADRSLATVAVSLIVAAPLVRVAWLVFRWGQEGDLRFVAAGSALLAVVAVGGLLAWLEIGV